MKTLAKILLRLSLAVLPCLAVACTSEVETTGGTPETPENPQANDPNRRSAVTSLQTKLMLSAAIRKKGLTHFRNVSPTVRRPESCPRVFPRST